MGPPDRLASAHNLVFDTAARVPHTMSPPTPRTDAYHKSIAEEINAATTTLHHDLNLLISSRIPLSLPPKSSDPSLYTLGLDAFATVYFTFEKAHAEFNSSKLNETKNPHTRPAMRQFLQNVIPDHLCRTPHFHKDIDYLTHGYHAIPRLSAVGAANAPLDTWVEDIYASVPVKPHLLVAYFWTMYMAIFAGGRFIRQALADAGEEFWDRVPVSVLPTGQQLHGSFKNPTTPQLESGPPFVSGSPPSYKDSMTLGLSKQDKPASLTHLGYTFLSFSPPAKYDPVTGDDGASIRDDFQERLKDAEELLTREERDDIVAEAQNIFLRLMDVVNALGDEHSLQTVGSRDPVAILTPRTQNDKESLSHEGDIRRMRIHFRGPSPAAVSWRTKLVELGKLLLATMAFVAFWYLMVFMFF